MCSCHYVAVTVAQTLALLDSLEERYASDAFGSVCRLYVTCCTSLLEKRRSAELKAKGMTPIPRLSVLKETSLPL